MVADGAKMVVNKAKSIVDDVKMVTGGMGRIGIGKHGIYKIPHKKGDGRRNNNTIRESDIPRKVYYHFIEKPETDFPNPTFIFAYADYAVVDAIFRVMVGGDNDTGVARIFTIREEINRPIRRGVAMWLIYIELIDPHPDFLSMKETAQLMEHLMLKYGRALSMNRVSFEKVYNI